MDVQDIGDWYAVEVAEIMRLTARGWVECGSIEFDANPAVGIRGRYHGRAEVENGAISVVEALGHIRAYSKDRSRPRDVDR